MYRHPGNDEGVPAAYSCQINKAACLCHPGQANLSLAAAEKTQPWPALVHLKDADLSMRADVMQEAVLLKVSPPREVTEEAGSTRDDVNPKGSLSCQRLCRWVCPCMPWTWRGTLCCSSRGPGVLACGCPSAARQVRA